MEILYNGTDITELVAVKSCVARDTCLKCDSLDIEFENAAGWYAWGPEEDDEIQVGHGGYDTGVLYVNSVLPRDGRYRIFATSLPTSARTAGWESFAGKTIAQIVHACALGCGMDFGLYGVDGGILIPYIQREMEGRAAFLQRLARLEGAELKCVNGRMAVIGLEYAQTLEARQTLQVTADMPGMQYTRSGRRLRTLTVSGPFGSATATDTDVAQSYAKTVSGLGARNPVQAGRWARGLLRHHNRQAERLCVDMAYNPGFTALARIDVEDEADGADAAGEWIVEEVRHDFIELHSRVMMRRVIETVV